MRRDPYEVLGVARDADERQIKRSFRSLARELHPDVNRHDPEAEEKFKEAAEAYEILSDDERRATYDRYGFEGLDSRGFASAAHGFGSFADIFDAFFGGDPFGGSFGRGSRPGAGGRRGRGGRDLAGGSGPGHDRRGGLRPGRPVRALPGQRRRARHADRDLLSVPGGRTGPGSDPHRVRPARARAGLRRLRRRGPRALPALRRSAAGRGRRAQRRTLEVDVPPGIADEQRIRLAGRGHAGERGGPPGDLYLLVHVTADERFLRDGSDLVTVVDVPAPAAALGTSVRVPLSTASRRWTCRPAPSRARS